jgi:hypothetical protein
MRSERPAASRFGSTPRLQRAFADEPVGTTEEPVATYLRQIVKVALLTQQDEQRLARALEAGAPAHRQAPGTDAYLRSLHGRASGDIRARRDAGSHACPS